VKRSFYDFPALYDSIHLADTPEEARAALSVIERHQGGVKTLLEPACGTGRFLEYFAERGFDVFGYDANPRAIAFAARRLRRFSARVEIGDMRSYRAPRLDAAFSLIGTFRHLLSDRDALAHLRAAARSLPSGGTYVIGFDLVDYDDCPPDEEGWEVRKGARRLRHLYQTMPPDRRRRLELVVNFVTVSTSRGDRVLQDDYELRSYDVRQWKDLIGRSPFRLAGTYDAQGEPMRLDKTTRYALFALEKARRR
jgi:SAM-dependent methyltransferase